MKKRVGFGIYTALSAVLLSSICLVAFQNLLMRKGSSGVPVTYSDVIEFRFPSASKIELSLDFASSDYMPNQAVLNHLIATLVKYDNAGRLTPFLAESWTESSDSLRWEFKLKEGFKDQSGRVITAEEFSRDLHETLRKMKASKTAFWVKDLVGWSTFVNENRARVEGVSVSGNKLILEFTRKPEILLNYLRMPYFGYWGDNRDRPVNRFVSSGPYSLEEVSDGEFTLKLRDEFSLGTSTQIHRVKYSQKPISMEEVKNSRMITIVRGADWEKYNLERFKSTTLPPDTLAAVVISPSKDSVFSNNKSRKTFSTYLKHILSRAELSNLDVRVRSFYGVGDLPKNNSNRLEAGSLNFKPGRAVRLLTRPSWVGENDESAESEVIAFMRMNSIPFVITRPSDLSPKERKTNIQRGYFDLRFVNVVTGQNFIESVVEMMFCSDMGIGFPDPNGSICDLLKKAEDPDEAREKELNRIVDQEGYIIPYARIGSALVYSPNVNLESYPAGTPYLQFHMLNEKK